MPSSIQLPNGQTIYIFAKTKVQAKCIVEAMQATIQNGMRKVGQTVTNKIVSRSLPNNPQSGKNPGKKNVNALKRRIQTNFFGENNDYLTTFPNDEGKPIWSIAEGASSLPIVVEKKYRGRPKKGRKVNKPDKVFEPMALVSYIKRNTIMKKKGRAAMRVIKKGADFVWTTKENLTKAMKVFQMRAGNNIFGWDSLAKEVNSIAIQRSLNMDKGKFDSPGGNANFSPQTYTPTNQIKIQAQNMNAPLETRNYQQRVIDVNIGKWVDFAFKNELKHLTPKQLVKGAHLPDDVQVTWTA